MRVPVRASVRPFRLEMTKIAGPVGLAFVAIVATPRPLRGAATMAPKFIEI